MEGRKEGSDGEGRRKGEKEREKELSDQLDTISKDLTYIYV